MQHDDEPRGRVCSRREALALMGAAGAVVLARPWPASAAFLEKSAMAGSRNRGSTLANGCVVRPEQTEGPYFVDEELERSDIRSDPSDGSVKPGAQLQLVFNVTRLSASTCIPLAGVLVDLWHCDALGVYSDVQDPGFDTRGKKFLRGYQLTDTGGVARFTTIYPGWYSGRTVHMHFKVRSAPASAPGFDFTSQLYFDDALTDQVHAQQPYAGKAQRTLRNTGDGIYSQGGSQLLLAVSPDDAGYSATFDIALDLPTAVRPGSWSGLKEEFRSD